MKSNIITMGRGVLTSYHVNGTKYCSYILGNNMTRINVLMNARGLNEMIESSIMEVEKLPDYTELNDEDLKKRLPEILHTACFISVVALKSKSLTIEEVLGDEGIIHELTHKIADIEGCNKKSLSCIRDLLKNLQKNAIGFYEPV